MIAIFTPTNRPGGLDVLEASLNRQSYKDFIWIVSDELREERQDIWEEIVERSSFHIFFIDVPKKEGNKRNLAATYNNVADFASSTNAKLLVSLQDYMYLPKDGLQRFLDVHKEYPNDLLTGVTHISRDPFPTKIDNLQGKYTIFKEPFTDQPRRLFWEDVRVSELYIGPERIVEAETGHWEANWAAVPVLLLIKGARWNEDYDKGIAYENMDFAQRCRRDYDARVILDKDNVAISLPHKDYFPGEREEIEQYSNRELYESLWMR